MSPARSVSAEHINWTIHLQRPSEPGWIYLWSDQKGKNLLSTLGPRKYVGIAWQNSRYYPVEYTGGQGDAALLVPK